MESIPYTDALMEMVENGMVDTEFLILGFCKWLGESGVRDFCKANEYIMEDLEESDCDDMDGDASSALSSVGWGTDEDYGYYGDTYE